MARRSRKREPNGANPAYRSTFQSNGSLLARLDCIVGGKPDPAPGSSNSEILEGVMAVLSAGGKAPPSLELLNGRVEWALRELFMLRDVRA